MASILTPEEMRELLATLLEGAAGETHEGWLRAIGPVEKLPTHTNVRCNWAVHPKGTAAQKKAITRAVELVREQHPYVAR